MKQAGVYKITNIHSGKFYYGSSDNLNRREQAHFRLLERNAHENKHLQASFNLHGRESFRFEIVGIVFASEADLDQKLANLEQVFLDRFSRDPLCFNLSQDVFAPMRGRRHTEEAKRKMREAKQGKFLGKENPMFGKRRPDTSARNKANCGSKAPCWGRTGSKHPMWGKRKVVDSNQQPDRIHSQ